MNSTENFVLNITVEVLDLFVDLFVDLFIAFVVKVGEFMIVCKSKVSLTCLRNAYRS